MTRRAYIAKDSLFSSILISIYVMLAGVFFFFVALPYLQHNIIVGADSKTYIETAKFYENSNAWSLGSFFSLKYNFFGPVLLLLATKYDYFVIFIINIFILLASSMVVFKYIYFKRLIFFTLLFVNPITLLSLVTVNKEIFGLCGMLLLMAYIAGAGKKVLFMSIVFALLTRWQQVVFIPIILIYLNAVRFDRKFSWQSPLLFLLGTSVVYPFIATYISFTGDTAREGVQAQFNQIGGLLPFLNLLQSHFMYFLVFLPKALINYVGNFVRVGDIFNSDIDIYNRFLVGHQIIMLITLSYLFLTGKIKHKSDSFKMIYIYSVIYCVALTINYRYFYPIYGIFIIMSISSQYIEKHKFKAESHRLISAKTTKNNIYRVNS